MDNKIVHRLVTKLSFKAGYDNPQQLYREVYDEMQITKENLKNRTRLQETYRTRQLNTFLSLILGKTRKPKMLNNTLTAAAPYVHKLNGIRHYQFDHNNYPSVTSILKHGSQETFDPFANWEQKLIETYGEKVGRRKKNIASVIGDYVHHVLESYLLTGMLDRSIVEKTLAKHLLPFLDEVEEVIAVELPVYSKRGYAGRIDAVLKLKDGTTAIVDFKTSNTKRTPSNCKVYRAQAAAYALALYERHGIKVDEIILAVVYKKVQGVRKPTRHSILRTKDIREHLNFFLEHLDHFNAKSDSLGIEVAF